MLTKTSFARVSRAAANVQFNAPDPKKPMGGQRLVLSALSLLAGLGMIYVSMHYLPALFHPQSAIDLRSSTIKDRRDLSVRSKYGPILGPYIDAFFMKRTYLEGGQSIEIHYNLPIGAELELAIQQCRRIFVIEVFKCDVIASKAVTVRGGETGRRTFNFPNTGFYHFDDRLTLENPDQPYRIVWSRK